MEERKDYSGEFMRHFRYEDFSKELLGKLLCEYGRLYELMDGLWYSTVAEEVGPEKAWEWEMKVWRKIPRHVLRGLQKVANIQGNDLYTLFKAVQLDPCYTDGLYQYDIFIRDPKYAIMTIYRCPSLLYFEKTDPGRIKPLCVDLEPPAFQDYCDHFNPKIKVTPLKLPPRKSPGEIPVCMWEYKMED